MTLAKIIDTLKMIALKHPNINLAYEGNIYDILNAKPDNKYASVVITQQSHTTDETYDHYGFVIFYVDRLLNDLDENRVQIQSIGKSMLGNIITAFCNEFEAECDNIIYQPFTQRFADETAGVYCTITIDTVKDAYCAERYWDESWTAPIVSIKNVDKTITITENGHYVLDYDPTIYTGIGKVDIDVDFNTEPFYNEGYDQGKTDGVNEQKSKLETINITENGTYTKEDGYNEIVVDVPDLNGSYDEGYEQGKTDGEQEGYNSGYEQGQADVAANARVLEVTENGTYLSKFSDPIMPIMPTLVTGVFDDGTEFHSYAELSSKVFNTKIAGSVDSRLEFWYKGNNTGTGNAWDVMIGSGNNDDDDCFQVRYFGYYDETLYIGVGNSYISVYNWDDTVWHHLIVSKAEGLWIDGEKKGDFSPSNTINGEFFINGIGYSNTRNANGCFGMIKIDDTIIIPTAEGFKNVNTGELLEVVHNGDYTFTENLPIYGEGELYKTINVNVIPKINPQKEGLRLGYSTFTEVPEWVDFNGVTNMTRMFSDCTNLQTIPLIDTSNVSNMDYMFNNCSSLQTIPLIDTSSVSNMTYMFTNCSNLQTIPKIDTSNVTDMGQMFYNFSGIKTLISLPKFNCQKVTNMYRYFSYYADGMSALTDVGGWENLKCDWNDNYGLRACPNLTYQSCINILNGLYDFRGNGESTTKTLKVNPNFLTTVGDKISIGTSRGWAITA